MAPREATIYAEFERLLAESRLPVVAYRMNAGEFMVTDPRTGHEFRIKGMPAGFADYMLWLGEGRTFFVEFKTARGRQSPKQINFEASCRRFGFEYQLCRSAAEAVDAVRAVLQGSPLMPAIPAVR